MEFTGPLVVGGPNVTITGSAESIYKQIKTKNPAYDAWEFPEYQERMAAKGIKRGERHGVSKKTNSLTKRQWAVNQVRL